MNEKWIGHYVYDDIYLSKKHVPFELEWIIHNNTISGTCVDEESKDIFTSPAMISGTLINNYVSFIKLTPIVG